MNYIFLTVIIIALLLSIFIFRCNIHKFDRKIQQPLSSVILLLSSILCVLLLFFLAECIVRGTTPNWHNFLRLYGLFSQTNSAYSLGTTETDAPFYMVFSLFGAILFSGLMISAFTNMFNQRIYNIREGHIKYNFSNHIIIIGANSSLISIINSVYLCDKTFQSHIKGTNEAIKILVISSKHPSELSYIKDCVKKSVWNNLYFINDNIMRPILSESNYSDLKEHYLRKSGAERSKAIYIIGDNEPDATEIDNIQILSYLINYLNLKGFRRQSEREIDCYIAFTNLEIMINSIREYESPQYMDILSFLKLKPYDFNMMLASKVWGACVSENSSYCTLKPNRDGKCHINIVGFNAIGIAMLKMAILKCHFGKGITTDIIVYYSKEEEKAVKLFLTNYDIESLSDISISFERINHTIEFADKYTRYACNIAGPTTVVLCGTEIDINTQLTYAIQKHQNRPDIIFYSSKPMLGGITNDNKGNSQEHIHLMGNLNQAIEIDQLIDATVFLYMIHNLTTECKHNDTSYDELLSLSQTEILKNFNKYKSQYFHLSFDNVRWRLMSLIESFCRLTGELKIYPDEESILNQQIAATVLSGYSILKNPDNSASKEESYRRKSIPTTVFDTETIKIKLKIFIQLKNATIKPTD